MKILITAQGEGPDAQVDPRFGRAQMFVLHDTESGAYTALPNAQNLQAPQGAGIQAGRNAVDSGAAAVLTGNCGPKAFRVLSQGGVEVYVNVQGTVRQAVEAFLAGQLTRADNANVEGHW